jgi:hypothetical protein
MKFLIALITLIGIHLSLAYAQVGTITNTPSNTNNSGTNQNNLPTATPPNRMNQMYPPDSIYSPWPPFNQPRPGTLPTDPENQQNFPTPQPVPAPGGQPSIPPTQGCLPPGTPAEPGNPNLLPCPTTPGNTPAPGGIDPKIPNKADLR